MRSTYFGLFLACLCLSTAQVTKSSESPDEQAIRDEDAAWLKAVHANDIDRIVSFYADDACEFPIEEPIACGKKAIRANWAHMLGIPGLRLTWQLTKVEVSHEPSASCERL